MVFPQSFNSYHREKKTANTEFTSQDFKIYEMCMNLQHTKVLRDASGKQSTFILRERK